MGERAWQRQLGEVASRTRWQGERRRCRPDSPIARLNRLRGIDLRRTEQNSLWHGEELVRELRKGVIGERHRSRRVGQEHACGLDRKSTRLNSSHITISYAVFCLKKKNNECKFKKDKKFKRS